MAVTPKPLFRYNDPGYTFGGPIPIRKWNLRSKLFFFWSQEWQLQLVPNTARNATVPTALERKGDFSQSVSSANHKPVTIYDPNTGQPFPGNVIPANRIWAPGQALLNLYPDAQSRRLPRVPTFLRAPPTITRPSCRVRLPDGRICCGWITT